MRKKQKAFPYKLNKGYQIEADGHGLFSRDALNELFNNPNYIYPRMVVDTFKLSDQRKVSILRSGEGYLIFENRWVDSFAEQRDGAAGIEHFLQERPKIGEEEIAVAIHEENFQDRIWQQGGKLPHAFVAEKLLSDMRKKSLDEDCKPVSVNTVEKTIGIRNLGVISKAHENGYVIWEERLSDYDAHRKLHEDTPQKEPEGNADKLVDSLDGVGFKVWDGKDEPEGEPSI